MNTQKLSGWLKVVHRLIIVGIVLAVLLPFYWIGVMSVTPQRHIAGKMIPTMVPRDASPIAYAQVLGFAEVQGATGRSAAQMYRRSLMNSIIVAATSTLLALVLGTVAAYALARLDFPGKNVAYVLILGSRLLAQVTLAVPMFILFHRLRILDTYLPLIIMNTSFCMAWVTLIMNNYFDMIDKEMEDSARVDGCTRFGAFWRILLPMAIPGVISVMLISFLFSWGEFLYALLFTSTAAARTMPVVMSMFLGQFAIEYRLLAAGLAVGVLPPVLLALVFQRFIISGLTQGGMKG
ncbi:carbohydrate ABC transporter membrane protein 2, CUT1 family [Alkalispirochaeta americana]|uniref:Carbohydrate ABC transporter membrane protein 2, CUT1 family n=1 Tax=Alkalispirochaeta americana TaxID=159291 RepID=A0A1N6PV36_9SPIO|nr:carbohydrate ABC transporter permease [Alkalispirochaeta americana]SIQ08145.1 carbohydrate ABC transporter membrane protein 2, CUT1 family [Alkalispirochaeta americana]